MLDEIKELIGILSFFLVGITWLFRLEARVNRANEKVESLEKKQEHDILGVESKADAFESKIMDKLSIIEKSLAKIEGRLSIETQR